MELYPHLAAAAYAHVLVLILSARAAAAHRAVGGDEEPAAELRRMIASAELRERATESVVNDGAGQSRGRDVNHESGDGRPGGGARAAGKEGSMGDPNGHDRRGRRFAAPERAHDDSPPALSHEEALLDASRFGMIGLLGAGPSVPHASFSNPEAQGRDVFANAGSLWQSPIGETYGGGLGLTGIGEGGGGKGEGTIGLGRYGLIGHTYGPSGYHRGGGGPIRPKRPSWDTNVPYARIRYGSHLRHLKDPILRVLHAAIPRVKRCYETAALLNPTLRGTVSVRFLIGKDGTVKSAVDAGSTLPDKGTVSCVLSVFWRLSFDPRDEPLSITFPIQLST